MARAENPATKVYWKRIRNLAWPLQHAVGWGHDGDLFEAVDHADPNVPPAMLLTAIDQAIKRSERDIECHEEEIANLRTGITKLKEFRAVKGRAAMQVVA